MINHQLPQWAQNPHVTCHVLLTSRCMFPRGRGRHARFSLSFPFFEQVMSSLSLDCLKLVVVFHTFHFLLITIGWSSSKPATPGILAPVELRVASLKADCKRRRLIYLGSVNCQLFGPFSEMFHNFWWMFFLLDLNNKNTHSRSHPCFIHPYPDATYDSYDHH